MQAETLALSILEISVLPPATTHAVPPAESPAYWLEAVLGLRAAGAQKLLSGETKTFLPAQTRTFTSRNIQHFRQ